MKTRYAVLAMLTARFPLPLFLALCSVHLKSEVPRSPTANSVMKMLQTVALGTCRCSHTIVPMAPMKKVMSMKLLTNFMLIVNAFVMSVRKSTKRKKTQRIQIL